MRMPFLACCACVLMFLVGLVSADEATARLAGNVRTSAIARSDIEAKLLPHIAIYDLSLYRADTNAGIAAVDGRMVVESRGSRCRGWRTTSRLVTRIDDGEGGYTVTDRRFTSFEQHDGRQFSFHNETLYDGSPGDMSTASVHRHRDGHLSVSVDGLALDKVDVPDSTLFPVQFTVNLIEAGHSGREFVYAHLYDGQERPEIALPVAAHIKPHSANPASRLQGFEMLEQGARWPLQVTYFLPEHEDKGPSFSVDYVLHESGVSLDPIFDYGDFSIKGQLVSLRVLERQPCQN